MSTTEGKASGKSWLDKLPKDIFGSDVFVSYQGTYVWQANQVGHFAIGFAATSLFGWLVEIFKGPEDPLLYWIAVAVVIVYSGKEYIDLLIARHQAAGFFDYDQSELTADMLADTWFVVSGVLVGAGAYWAPWAGVAAAILFLISFFILRLFFLPAKVSLDRTALPFIFRLANFPETDGVRPENVSRIEAFYKSETVKGYEPPRAIVIQGFRGCGKTTLGIGIGSEIAVRKAPGAEERGKVLYFSAFSLFERGAAKSGTGPAKPIRRRKPWLLGTDDPWSVDEAEVLIIDDVDVDTELYSQATPDKIIAQLKANPDTLNLLKSKKTVWVTGTSKLDDSWKAWMTALAGLYGCTIDESRTGDEPADIEAREPVPVIWLRQPITDI